MPLLVAGTFGFINDSLVDRGEAQPINIPGHLLPDVS
jgi:hypothetical protein